MRGEMKMIVSEAIVKEVNQYYARRGGRRSVNTTTFSNFLRNASLSETRAAKSTERAEAETEAQNTEKSAEASPSRSKNADTCCEQCRLTGQLMLQLMSRSLYSQSGLGYTPVGTGALNAYQNMINILGNHTGLS